MPSCQTIFVWRWVTCALDFRSGSNLCFSLQHLGSALSSLFYQMMSGIALHLRSVIFIQQIVLKPMKGIRSKLLCLRQTSRYKGLVEVKHQFHPRSLETAYPPNLTYPDSPYCCISFKLSVWQRKFLITSVPASLSARACSTHRRPLSAKRCSYLGKLFKWDYSRHGYQHSPVSLFASEISQEVFALFWHRVRRSVADQHVLCKVGFSPLLLKDFVKLIITNTSFTGVMKRVWRIKIHTAF